MKAEDLKILVKFPSRERPVKLVERLKEYKLLADDENIQYLITLDADDYLSNRIELLNELEALNVTAYIGMSRSKVEAINRDMHKAEPWDICVLASDDMHCIVQGWDTIIKKDMLENFPDTDGVLWYWDGDAQTKGKLNTMCIFGRVYYQRFGYIYHPAFKSLWADNLFMEQADLLGRQFKSEQVLFKHVHFTNTRGMQQDRLMLKTQSFYIEDKKTYNKLKADGILQPIK